MLFPLGIRCRRPLVQELRVREGDAHSLSPWGSTRVDFPEISSRLQSGQGSEICCFHLEFLGKDSPFQSYGSAKAMPTRLRPGGPERSIFRKFLQVWDLIRGPKDVVSSWNRECPTPRSRVMGRQKRCRPDFSLGVRRERFS